MMRVLRKSNMCRNGLHEMTEDNVQMTRDGRCCIACRKLNQLRKRKTREGYCKRNLHKRTPKNTGPRGNCRPCERARINRRYQDGEIITVHCLAKGCDRNTRRSAARASDPYVCRAHREQPTPELQRSLALLNLRVTFSPPVRTNACTVVFSTV